jgi:hypothetical protein
MKLIQLQAGHNNDFIQPPHTTYCSILPHITAYQYLQTETLEQALPD